MVSRWETNNIQSYLRNTGVLYGCSLLLLSVFTYLANQETYFFENSIALGFSLISILISSLSVFREKIRLLSSLFLATIVAGLGARLFIYEVPPALETIILVFLGQICSFKFFRIFIAQLAFACIGLFFIATFKPISSASLMPIVTSLVVSTSLAVYLRKMYFDLLEKKIHLLKQQDILESQSKELKKSLSEKSILLKILCHDVTNPISVIDSYAELLSNRRSYKDTKVDEWVKKIRNACDSSMEILEHVQDLEALYSEDKKIPLSPVSVEGALEQAIYLIEDNLEQKSIDLEIDVLGHENLFVSAEPRSLAYQVFLNILTNAVKFSYKKGKVKVHIQGLESYVLIKISDHGTGIKESLRHQIFDQSSDYSSDGTLGEKGKGFGLSIVKAYVEKYGGTISLDSHHESEFDDHGSTFEIRLPRAQGATYSAQFAS